MKNLYLLRPALPWIVVSFLRFYQQVVVFEGIVASPGYMVSEMLLPALGLPFASADGKEQIAFRGFFPV